MASVGILRGKSNKDRKLDRLPPKGLHPPKPVIFRSNHASNALALVGTLPKDRDLLLQQIDEALTGHSVLRPEYLRGM